MSKANDIRKNVENIDEYIEENRDALTEIAKEIISRRIWLQIHFWLWLITNILLVIIFHFTNVEFRILGWTIIPWAFAVALHTFNYKAFRNGWFADPNEYAYGYGWFLFFIIALLTLFVDIFEKPDYNLNWWPWVLFGLSITIVIETIVYFIIKKRNANG